MNQVKVAVNGTTMLTYCITGMAHGSGIAAAHASAGVALPRLSVCLVLRDLCYLPAIIPSRWLIPEKCKTDIDRKKQLKEKTVVKEPKNT
eukprot:2129805-Amphidinium_carterae.1